MVRGKVKNEGGNSSQDLQAGAGTQKKKRATTLLEEKKKWRGDLGAQKRGQKGVGVPRGLWFGMQGGGGSCERGGEIKETH